ncbi:MAG: glycosyltransferase [Opitutaceae bacterium]
MRILHYTGVYAPAWSFGGPPRSVANLCEGLAALGHEVTVFTTNAGLAEDRSIPADRPVGRNGVTVHYFPSRQALTGLACPELEAAVRKRVADFDLVHVTGVWQPTSVAACRAAAKAGVPYICSPRGALGRYSFTQKPWKKWPYFWLRERRNLNQAAAVHYTARMEAEEAARLHLQAKPFVVPNSIDLTAWQRDQTGGLAWRERQGIAAGQTLFLYAGRLHHKKGLDLLLGACAGLDRSSRWKLALVGFDEDGSGARLQAGFARAGMGDRLLLLGGVETGALAAVYSAAAAFVFPSRHENFGNVVVEALACGCPVLSSDQVGAVDELAGLAGVLTLPRDAAAWTQALTTVLEGRGPAAGRREEIENRFSKEAVARRMLAEYEKLGP